MFELFDPKGPLAVREGALPHWYQPGVSYFVTFRTADSIPTDVMRRWHRERDEWLQRHGVDPGAIDWKARFDLLPLDAQRDFHRTFTTSFMKYLDSGYGDCVLKNPALAQIVSASLQEFDDARYVLADSVIMPNHVHLLCCLLNKTEIERQCRSWKKFTATEINRVLRRKGRFWQEESFDHLVRSPEQFEYLQTYIAHNPVRAKLREGEFVHYHRPTK
jgi:type I restriction enzyme R subunit